jgi:hypothetical protein
MLINSSNAKKYHNDLFRRSRGLVFRDLRKHPVNSVNWDTEQVIIPREDWPALIEMQEESQSRISDIRMAANFGEPMEALDQGSEGYCWAYSTVACAMLTKAVANQPFEKLSPHAIGCKLQNFRNRGAWGALSMKFMAENGCPTEEFWPQQSMSRSHDNIETWDDARRSMVTESYLDVSVKAWDVDLGVDLCASLMLSNVPVVLDFDWWGHSVCGMDVVDLYPDKDADDIYRYGFRILNSWGDGWGDNGTAVLTGENIIPMGSCAARVLIGS